MIPEYFRKRRSVRRFSGREVPQGLIEEIVESAMRAPTTGNMQLYTVVETRDAERRRELAALHYNQPASTGCAVMLTVCADFARFVRWCEISGADPGYDNLLSLTSASLDAAIISQQIVTLAEMNGLGTCYLGTVTYNAEAISDMLGLPELVVPVCCLAIGWPDGEGDESERLPLQAVLHSESYTSFSDDDIRRLYAAKDDYGPNARFVTENGKQTLAQVFTDIRYPRKMNEDVSRALREYLVRQKFIK